MKSKNTLNTTISTLDIIQHSSDGVTLKEIAQEIGLSTAGARKITYKLKKLGLISLVLAGARTKYIPVEQVEQGYIYIGKGCTDE